MGFIYTKNSIISTNKIKFTVIMKKHLPWVIPVTLLIFLSASAVYFKLDGDFFRKYGAAVGPSLAFTLGIITFSLKHRFDESNEERKVEEIFSGLTSLIKASNPPKYIDNVLLNDEIGYTIDYDRTNGGNITTFYQRVLLISKRLEDIFSDNHISMSENNVLRLTEIKWWLDHNLKELEKHREEFAGVAPLFEKANLTGKTEDLMAANTALDSHFLNEKVLLFALSIGHENMIQAIENNISADLEYIYPEGNER